MKEKKVNKILMPTTQHVKMQEFLNDLVNAPSFAARKKTSATSVYTAINNGTIDANDIYIICGKQYWSWEKYKNITFRKYTH